MQSGALLTFFMRNHIVAHLIIMLCRPSVFLVHFAIEGIFMQQICPYIAVLDTRITASGGSGGNGVGGGIGNAVVPDGHLGSTETVTGIRPPVEVRH